MSGWHSSSNGYNIYATTSTMPPRTRTTWDFGSSAVGAARARRAGGDALAYCDQRHRALETGHAVNLVHHQSSDRIGVLTLKSHNDVVSASYDVRRYYVG